MLSRAWVVFCKKKNFLEILNLFKNAKAWKETASPPNEIIKEQIIVFSVSEIGAEEISKQPFVISKKPKIMPFETLFSMPIFENKFTSGENMPREYKISVITKKIAMYPPIKSTEFMPFSIVFVSMSVSLFFFG